MGGGGRVDNRSSSEAILCKFCRVFSAARSIEVSDHVRKSSSSSLDSRSASFVVSDFCSLYSAILAARRSCGVFAFLGSGGRSK
jgi:hypothetical protein